MVYPGLRALVDTGALACIPRRLACFFHAWWPHCADGRRAAAMASFWQVGLVSTLVALCQHQSCRELGSSCVPFRSRLGWYPHFIAETARHYRPLAVCRARRLQLWGLDVPAGWQLTNQSPMVHLGCRLGAVAWRHARLAPWAAFGRGNISRCPGDCGYRTGYPRPTTTLSARFCCQRWFLSSKGHRVLRAVLFLLSIPFEGDQPPTLPFVRVCSGSRIANDQDVDAAATRGDCARMRIPGNWWPGRPRTGDLPSWPVPIYWDKNRKYFTELLYRRPFVPARSRHSLVVLFAWRRSASLTLPRSSATTQSWVAVGYGFASSNRFLKVVPVVVPVFRSLAQGSASRRWPRRAGPRPQRMAGAPGLATLIAAGVLVSSTTDHAVSRLAPRRRQ